MPDSRGGVAGQLPARLREWAVACIAGDAVISGLFPMPGNAGLSYGFDVLVGQRVTPLVIRLSPPGVRRSGNTDVLRQVPLLRVLDGCGVPVARLVWQSADDAPFGTAAIIQHRLAALPLHMTSASGSVQSGPAADTGAYLRSAIRVLADVHRIDWQAQLPDWEPVRAPETEVGFWAPLLAKSAAGRLLDQASALRDRLLASVPARRRMGLFHGDYQMNNVLYEPGSTDVAAVVDWELAGVGLQGLDIAWLSMWTDPACWADAHRSVMRVIADPARLLTWYEQATGQPLPEFDWCRALACYRFGIIAAFNLYLHRTGRRADSTYVRLETSIPVLFERGLGLLGGSQPDAPASPPPR
jgi:aminoglycoside phosphotransferase (APT) family kinase protein